MLESMLKSMLKQGRHDGRGSTCKLPAEGVPSMAEQRRVAKRASACRVDVHTMKCRMPLPPAFLPDCRPEGRVLAEGVIHALRVEPGA